MFVRKESGKTRRLVVEASQQGILRIAPLIDSPGRQLGEIWSTGTLGLATFTDALQQFERETGFALHGASCAMAIAGPTSGETISPARCRWTITRGGLMALFGRPVTIINDVAARAWAIKSGTASIESVRGIRIPDLNRPGRYIMIMVEQGVGPSVIDVDREGVLHILEAEAGHMEFPAANATEEQLAKALKGQAPYVSWETMLMLDRQNPLWGQACPSLSDQARQQILVSMLARFAVNLMYAYAAWDGVLITGSRGVRMLDFASQAALEGPFSIRRTFGRLIHNSPVWRVEQREPVLTGAAECLLQDVAVEFRNAA